jgi:shikimate dehydrogenase
MTRPITSATVVAGVTGAPIAHSLSPLIHNAWLEAAGIDGVYVAFSPSPDGFPAFARGLRGGAIRGLNVTVPFKELALAIADRPSERAQRAGAANLLLFDRDETIAADNTDGLGLIAALAEQAPGFDVTRGPVVILGGGGAARGAAAALAEAGAPEIRVVNRDRVRAGAIEAALGPPVVAPPSIGPLSEANFNGAALVINATTLGLGGGPGPEVNFVALAPGAVAFDMVYQPLRTEFLDRAADAGLVTVDGLAMLIGQAAPSFEALFGAAPPAIDVRGPCLAALGARA